jgi:hypothetical protein
MADREPINWNVDSEVADRFREFVHEKKGRTRGELGREVERAMIEYMDHDRYERIEDGQETTHEKLDAIMAALGDAGDTHTHTADVSPTTVAEKRDIIAAQLRDRDAPVMPERDVVAAIEDVAGGDDRTLSKYMSALRRSGDVYDHPSSDSSAWTTDAEQFASWALGEFESRPDASIRDILEPYAMDPNEYEQLLDDAAASARANR